MKHRVGRSLILFPVPYQGHINPMLQLANILYSKGFSIIIIQLPLNPPNPLNYPHFTFYSIPDGLLEQEACTADATQLLVLINIKCVKPFSDCLSKLLLDVKEDPISCIITDAHWYFTQPVADSVKLPRIVIRTGDISSFLVAAAFPLLREKGYFGTKDSQLEEPIIETPPLKVKDLPFPVVKTQDQEELHSYVARMINGSKGSSGLIWNSFEELEQDSLTRFCQEFPIPIFTIGPFHKIFEMGLRTYELLEMFSGGGPSGVAYGLSPKLLYDGGVANARQFLQFYIKIDANLDPISPVLNIKCVKPFSDGLSKLLLDVKEEPISCIITDVLWYFTQALADSIKLPRIVLSTIDISTFHVLAALPLLREGLLWNQSNLKHQGILTSYQPFMHEFLKYFPLEEPVIEAPLLKVKDLPEVKTQDPEDFDHYRARTLTESKASSGFIWNTFEELQKDSLTRFCQEFPIPIFTIVVARYASDAWKIGIHLDDIVERGKIERIIKRLMVEAEGQRIRERIMSLKEKVNICVRKGGSSYRSLASLVDYILSF
ncbi:unnamed protein product [Dovyalis caffra]|uniref:UDP-glycosyltransferase n=1 Tax=Dovyalis caffra TaxID=77055 RepID=A0AAV1QQJ0_9ROSI|nr:unnamed protein product [Dovyalis caffra]